MYVIIKYKTYGTVGAYGRRTIVADGDSSIATKVQNGLLEHQLLLL
jgi:hypothetical protein